MIKELKDFITRGNLIELSVGLIIGLTFAAVVASFVANILTPIISAIFGQPDFSGLEIDVGDSAITYSLFLNAILSFLIVGLVLFLVVKAHNRMTGPKAATTKGCPFCKTEIAIDATRCPNCRSQLEAAAS